MINPATGQPHYARIYRREELYSGPLLDTMPDLIGHPADFRTVDSGMDFRSNKLFETDTALSGTHRIEGLFTITGPGVRRGEQISPIRIYDLAPTILYRLGVPVPDDMDGQAVAPAFEPDELAARPVQRGPASSTRTGGGAVFSDEDEETIKNRLRDLGYLS